MLFVHRLNPTSKEGSSTKQPNEEKQFVNLLPVYTIYKQKFRRISENEFRQMICRTISGKKTAEKLYKEFMKAKSVNEQIISFQENNGFLCRPRFLPLVALLAERAGYKFIPSEVANVDFTAAPTRFKEKFCYLLVHGFWFLGKVISDSLSEKDRVNRGNMFGFEKGDLGYWWAGVKILDWQNFLTNRRIKNAKVKFELMNSCHGFVINEPVGFQRYTQRAVLNMNQHPLFFLSEEDWVNYNDTVKSVQCRDKRKDFFEDDDYLTEDSECSHCPKSPTESPKPRTYSDVSSLSSRQSLDSLMSKESVD